MQTVWRRSNNPDRVAGAQPEEHEQEHDGAIARVVRGVRVPSTRADLVVRQTVLG